MAKELRVLGPPGSGKTRSLAERVERWVESGDYERRDIVLTSFTRAAAAVLQGAVELPRENVATLHAIAYRAMGNPPLAETGALAKQWNESGVPDSWKVDGSTASEVDGIATPSSELGALFRQMMLLRSLMAPAADPRWATLGPLVERWQDFKQQTDSYDWADLLEHAMIEYDGLPNGQPVLVVDEAQDMVPLQWALVRRWAIEAEVFMVAGDPAQVLFGFAGSSPEEFLRELPAEQQFTLPRSYRMPRLIQERAERWLAAHSGSVSLGREYAPRPEEGIIRPLAVRWQNPEVVLALIENEEREVMVLATAGYMLNPLIAMLREAGVPFHNPYRRSNGAWNPLGAAYRFDSGTTSTVSRVLAFQQGRPELWPEMVEASAFKMRGAKKHLVDAPETLTDWAGPELLAAWEARDLGWLAGRVTKQYRHAVGYAAALVARNGPDLLTAQPRVIVSTVHAAKGGEAPVVVLFPDLSNAAHEEATRDTKGHDAMIRVGYVGLSRARDELVLCTASSGRTMW